MVREYRAAPTVGDVFDAAHEERQRENDRVALERDQAARHDAGMPAPGYVHATDPDHGEPVVFVPGELLPEWAAEAFREQGPQPDAANVYRLQTGEAKRGSRS